MHKDVLALFNKLICKPGDTQAWKSQVGYQDTTPYNNPDVQVVACGNNGGQWGKYVLDVAKVQGKQVTSASAGLSTTSNQWQVNLSLNSAGAAAFSTLTSHLYNTYYSAGQAGDQNSAILDQVAIALDGNVVSAPQIIAAIPGGNAQITGNFTQAQATQLQNELKFGSVPLDLKTLFVTSVSAQVGQNQLDAGLIAAAIGLLLVVVYAFLYYRGLGLVSVCSLLIAGTITFLAVVLAFPVPELHPRAGRHRGPDRGHRHHRRLVRRLLRAIAGRGARGQAASPGGRIRGGSGPGARSWCPTRCRSCCRAAAVRTSPSARSRASPIPSA